MSSIYDKVFSKNKDFPWQTIDEETIVIDPVSKNSFELDSIGSCIWNHLDGVKSIKNIQEFMCAEYEVSTNEAFADIVEFVDFLETNNLIREV